MPWRTGREAVGHRLDDFAAVEVRGVGGECSFDLGNRDSPLGRLTLVAEGGADRLAIQADLLGLLAPEITKTLRGQFAVLRLPRCQGCNLSSASAPPPPPPPRGSAGGGLRRRAGGRGRSPGSRRCHWRPRASGRRGGGSARRAGGTRRCSRQLWRVRRWPGGRAGSSGPRQRWRWR